MKFRNIKHTEMKTNHLKQSFWIFLISFLIGISCNKENKDTDNGFVRATFTGMDFTMNLCSGGYFFTVADSRYRAYDIVQNSILDAQTEFPKLYLVKYEKPTGGCYDADSILVKITDIKLPDGK